MLIKLKAIILIFIDSINIIIKFNLKKINTYHVLCLPKNRMRYAIYYFNNENLLVLKHPNIINFILIKKIEKKVKYYFSDTNRSTIKKYLKYIDTKVYYICWNDEIEIIEKKEEFQFLNLEIINLFKNKINIKNITPKNVVIKNFNKKKLPIIFFAGNINNGLEYEFNCKIEQTITNEKIKKYLNEGYRSIFQINDYRIRHYIISKIRKIYIEELIKSYHKNLILCGKDFLIYKKYGVNVINELNQNQIQKFYRKSAINIDIGSQCGVEALYPRSLEILNINPSSLVQMRLPDSQKLFSDSLKKRTFKNPIEMVSLCNKILLESIKEKEEIHNLILMNIQKFNK